jgi:hypothetical protein
MVSMRRTIGLAEDGDVEDVVGEELVGKFDVWDGSSEYAMGMKASA